MRSEVDTCQPSTIRENTSKTNATYPAGMRADVGQVRHPELVRSIGDEPAID